MLHRSSRHRGWGLRTGHRPKRRWVLGLGCAALVLVAANASTLRAGEECDLEPGREAHVARVIDGETLELETGEVVRLVGALAPRAPDWWKGPGEWGPAEQAAKALERIAGGRSLHLAFGGRERDRHNRLLAQAFVVDELELIWVQGRLVAEGHARAYSFADNRACLRPLLEREARARAAGAGLWRHSLYAVTDATQVETLNKRRYTFQIVEGRVAAVGETRKWTFLNFSKDYKTDFTVAVETRTRKLFAANGLKLPELEGRRVRVRGWIEAWNGPVIKATHPEQIELLDGPPDPPKIKDPAPNAAPGLSRN